MNLYFKKVINWNVFSDFLTQQKLLYHSYKAELYYVLLYLILLIKHNDHTFHIKTNVQQNEPQTRRKLNLRWI